MEKVRDRSEQKAKYRQENREAIAAYQKAYRAERSRQAESRKYYEANAEALREKARRWKAEQPEKYAAALAAKRVPAKTPEQVAAQKEASRLSRAETRKRYKRRNPHIAVVLEHTRRARKRNSQGHLSLDVFAVKLHEQNGLCPYCATKVSREYGHLDHIMPLALGGANTDDNVQVTCPPCNWKKNARHPEDFKKYLLTTALQKGR